MNKITHELTQEEFNAQDMFNCLNEIKEAVIDVSKRFPSIKISYKCENSSGGIIEGVRK